MKLVATSLALALILTCPGLAPYEAFAAQLVSRPQAGALARPGAAPVVLAPQLPSLAAPYRGGSIGAALVPTVGVPAAAPIAAPAAPMAPAAVGVPAAQAVPTALDAGRALQEKITAPQAQPGPALESFYANAKLSDKGADAVPGSESAPKPGLQPSAQKEPVSPDNHPELFAPRSSRVGVGPAKYVYWNALYNILQWFNLKLAKDPNRRVSWDKWPTKLGLLYLIGKIRFVRSGTLTDPYDYASSDVKPAGAEPEAAKKGYTADGSWVSDRENPRMGAENTRFGSNIPPKKVRPDVEHMTPSAREAGKLKWRKLDENGKPIVQPAGILNNLAGGWIQFQFHNFGGNTKRDPIEQNPHKMPRTEGDNWPEKEATVDRTSQDPTRVTENGRPTVMNERTQAWIQAQIYGTNEAEQKALRSFSDGKFLLDAKGMLPEDPKKKGVDLSGFTNNYNPLLSFLHWAFVVNHNAIADHLKKFNPGWDDETLFQQARKINVANTALIHTVEWTEDLLQHRTLQEGMHAEFYGLFGPKVKAWLMRLSYRHPWFAKLIKPVSNNDVIWGMPGSKWEHHDGPFQVPKHFRMVYRLHELILDEQEMIQPGSDRTLDRVQLIDFVHNNTRPIVEKFGYDVLAYSFAKKSAGALKLHNFPRALSQFKNMQNGQLTDLAELDIFRERTDGTGSYNEFRRSLGEPPVKSFLELTGGDAELAKELELKYEGDIEKVDAGIGILAEPKPEGFALGFTQFYQFVLNAPRRVKSNRHLTEYFTHKDYTFEGMEWVLHSGGMGGVIARAMKGLPHGKEVVASMEGVTRWFAPWPETETFPVRMLDKTAEDSGRILKATARLAAAGTFTAFAAWMGVAVSGFALVPAVALGLSLPILLYYKRMLAWRFMQKAWQSAYTDRRRTMFPTLFLGEKWASRAASLGKLGAKAALVGGGFAAFTLFATNPVVALLAGATALSSLSVLSATKAYENDMAVLKISLQNRLREGYPVTTDPASVPGRTALEKRYWFLVPKGSDKPVATFWHSYRALHEHGLGRVHAFKTALFSHLIFGPRTQRGLGLAGRREAGTLLNPFAIYVPNMAQAQGASSTGIYKSGEVDLKRFDELFSTFAPGRDYMTAYDFARMRESTTPWLASFAAKYRTDQLLQLYADRVANEDKVLVPAISRETLLRVYQGTAQIDVMRERALDGVHPDLQVPKPLGPDGAAKKTLWQKAKGYGWKGVAAVAAFYLVRDTILYILIPYLMYKGIIG